MTVPEPGGQGSARATAASPGPEAFLRALFGNEAVGVDLVDAEGRWVDANARLCAILDRPREQLVGSLVADLTHPEDAAEERRNLRLLREGRASRYAMRKRMRRDDGRWTWVEVDVSPIPGGAWTTSIVRPSADEADDRPARYDGLVRQVLHSAPLPMGIVELPEGDGDILHVFDNPATCRSFGLPSGATAGLWDGTDLGVAPSTIRTWVEAYRASQRLGHAVHFEDCHVHDGDRRWLGVVVTHVGKGAGGRERFCYIAEDITDRKRFEEEILRLNRSLERQAAEIQAVLEVLPIGVGIADDRNCRSIRANPALSEMLRSPAGRNVSKTAPDGERPTSFRLLRDGVELVDRDLPMQVSARDGVTLRDVEIDVLFDDGRLVKLLENVAPLFDEQGTPRGSVGAFLDVTERRRAEEERERLVRELRDADRRKDEFLAILAHELRGPLAAAVNASQILAMSPLEDPNARWCVDVIERQARRLSRLLDDLLDHSRIASGKIALRREVVDLRDVVERALETARPVVESRRHRLELLVPPSPLAIDADPARIEQVIVNLVSNAAKYSEDGRSIRVAVEDDGPVAIVRVDDDGVGMAAETLSRAFDAFAQSERSLDRSAGGLGIGLSISRTLIEMHGGALSAASAGLGLGSTFVVRLPRAERLDDSAALDRDGESDGRASSRVLVVDDDEDSAESLARLLRAVGHEVRTAPDGPTALSTLTKFRPAVVVLDLILPGMDGFEVATRLRSLPAGRDATLVALSGHGRDADRRRALEAGFDRHLVKPVELATLLEAFAAEADDR